MMCMYSMSNITYQDSWVESIAIKAMAIGLLMVLASIIIVGIAVLINPQWLLDGILRMFPLCITGIIIIAVGGKVSGVIE